ncbi:MAG: hypothetical protein ACOC0D_08975 [Spirochaeta sp.]
MHSRRKFLAGLLLLVGAAVCSYAQEHDLRGEAELSVLQSRDGLVELLRIYGDYRVSYDWGEFGLRHNLSAFPDQQLLHQLNQAAVTVWPADAVTLRMGRFSIPWGLGYAFHSGDALHPPRTPAGDAPGFDGAAFTWTLTPDWGISAAVRVDTAHGTLEKPYRNLRWAGKVTGYIAEVETMLAAVYQPDTVLRNSAGVSYAVGPVVLHAEGAVEYIGDEQPGQPLTGGSPGNEPAGFQSVSSSLAVPDILGADTGWAAAAGANLSQYWGDHLLSAVAEYLYLSEPPAGFGAQAVYAQTGWEWDSRLSLEQTVLADISNRRGLLISAAVFAPYSALEISLEGVMSIEKSGGISSETGRISVRIFF